MHTKRLWHGSTTNPASPSSLKIQKPKFHSYRATSSSPTSPMLLVDPEHVKREVEGIRANARKVEQERKKADLEKQKREYEEKLREHYSQPSSPTATPSSSRPISPPLKSTVTQMPQSHRADRSDNLGRPAPYTPFILVKEKQTPVEQGQSSATTPGASNKLKPNLTTNSRSITKMARTPAAAKKQNIPDLPQTASSTALEKTSPKVSKPSARAPHTEFSFVKDKAGHSSQGEPSSSSTSTANVSTALASKSPASKSPGKSAPHTNFTLVKVGQKKPTFEEDQYV